MSEKIVVKIEHHEIPDWVIGEDLMRTYIGGRLKDAGIPCIGVISPTVDLRKGCLHREEDLMNDCIKFIWIPK